MTSISVHQIRSIFLLIVPVTLCECKVELVPLSLIICTFRRIAESLKGILRSLRYCCLCCLYIYRCLYVWCWIGSGREGHKGSRDWCWRWLWLICLKQKEPSDKGCNYGSSSTDNRNENSCFAITWRLLRHLYSLH